MRFGSTRGDLDPTQLGKDARGDEGYRFLRVCRISRGLGCGLRPCHARWLRKAWRRRWSGGYRPGMDMTAHGISYALSPVPAHTSLGGGRWPGVRFSSGGRNGACNEWHRSAAVTKLGVQRMWPGSRWTPRLASEGKANARVRRRLRVRPSGAACWSGMALRRAAARLALALPVCLSV